MRVEGCFVALQEKTDEERDKEAEIEKEKKVTLFANSYANLSAILHSLNTVLPSAGAE